jgi:amidase
MTDELWRLTARQAVDLLRRREVSPFDLVDAALARIAETEPHLNALPTLCPERAREAARAVMLAAPETTSRPNWLAGLPIAIKDLMDVAGVRTTYGSSIFAHHVPTASDVLVERLEANGAVVLAKSNTPEFGAGGVTFNEVFGIGRNPWNTDLTPGGSSGGAAAALAAGQVWLAQGSDMGGSLRTPAAFCGVVGLRPSPGRVPRAPELLPFDMLSVEGPMGRNVGDVALFLDAMVGSHPADPIALETPARSFLDSLDGPLPSRAAFSPDLGIGPVEPEVARIASEAALRLSDLGVTVDGEAPSFAHAHEAFQTLRAASFAAGGGDLLARERARLKPDYVWNVEKGLALSQREIGRAERLRGELVARMGRFFQTHDLLLCPAAIVPPFLADMRTLERLGDHVFETYIHWIGITYAVTLTGCPVLALPCGLTQAGLPVGLQIVGPPRGEARVLAAGHALEALLGMAGRVPRDPRIGERGL